MKTYLKTYILIGLFFGGLLAVWWLEHAGIRTENERRLRETRILPDLIEVPELSVRKVAIERGKERLVFERRGPGVARWQMVEPKDVAAEPTRLESLVRNLKELRKSPDAGSVAGAADTFGLAPPVATISLWGETAGEANKPAGPIATLALGKTVRGTRYVRAGGTGDIEIADSKLLTVVDLPVTDFREQVVMGVPTFQVASVTIKRPGRVIRAARDDKGRWNVTEPVNAPANPAKLESLLSALSSLRVVDGEKGFVADNVKDFTPFGLAGSEVTVELTTTVRSEEPLVLHVGKPVPGHPDRVYVRQGDQDDVVIVDAKALSEVPQSAVALRSHQVSDIEPAAVTQIEIQTRGEKFALTRGPRYWELTAPRKEKADTVSVTSFLSRIDTLETSDFFQPNQVGNPELDPPVMTIKIWEKRPAQSPGSSRAKEPALVLRIGKHDLLRKTVFARLENDEAILAVPDTFVEVLPKNTFAFRDLTMLSLNPADIRKLTVTRQGRIDELEPNKGGEPNRWRLRRPIDAPADTKSVTQILVMLANLRADQLITDSAEDGKKFGLDHPLMEIAWETDRVHRLKIGSPVPRSASYFAQAEDPPFVFTIKTEVLRPLEAELRDHVVLTFPADRAERIMLNWHWPPRTVAFRHRSPSPKGQPDWVDEPGFDATGIDQSRVAALVKALSHLEAIRFVQYDGEIPPYTGLHRARLTIEAVLSAVEPTRVLRIGYPTNEGHVFAAEGTSGSGPVFLLPAPAWDALIQSGERFNPLPANVFRVRTMTAAAGEGAGSDRRPRRRLPADRAAFTLISRRIAGFDRRPRRPEPP